MSWILMGSWRSYREIIFSEAEFEAFPEQGSSALRGAQAAEPFSDRSELPTD